jgi:2-methylcitrate dehydratase PrpD
VEGLSDLSVSRRFARWASRLKFEDLPPAVIDKAQALLLHALVGGLLGANSSSARAVVEETLVEEGRSDGATVFHTDRRASRIGAAFANAELIHASFLFDSYRMLTHPGPVIVPAALAQAQLEQRSGQDLLVALVAGYELTCRLADEFIPSTAARGFRPSPLFATLGAALTCGLLMGLDEDRLVTAIALGANFASGLNEGPRTGSNELLLHEPQATRNGVFAAMMARSGHIRGSETSLEGRAGFFNAFTGNHTGELSYSFTGRRQVDPSSVTEGLGQHYKVLDFMFRMYPCPGYNQPVIELMRELCQRHALRAADIARVRIEMNWIETRYPSPAFPRYDDWQQPRPWETTHYFAARVAVAGDFPVANGRGPGASDEDATREAQARAFMPRVELVPQELRPMFSPAIAIECQDGRVFEGSYPYERMAWDSSQLLGRLQACAPGIDGGGERLATLADLVASVPRMVTLQPLLAFMQGPAS